MTTIIQDSMYELAHECDLRPILEMWKQPGRFYHGVTHLEQMLVDCAEISEWYDLDEFSSEQLSLAAWFHDAIYEAGNKWNESNSAELAEDRVPMHLVDVVSGAIYATADHSRPDSFVAACLIDADLKGLGTVAYWENRLNVRLEYGDVSEEAWESGRSAFLKGMLSRRKIFHTSWGAQFEWSARENMKLELNGVLK